MGYNKRRFLIHATCPQGLTGTRAGHMSTLSFKMGGGGYNPIEGLDSWKYLVNGINDKLSSCQEERG